MWTTPSYLLVIACVVVGLAIAIAVVAHASRLPRARGSMIDVSLRLTRWLFAALLAASGIWIAISPRAEQPLLDAMERAFPAIRSAYMDEERDPLEAAKLGAREKNRWWIAGVFVLLAASFVVSVPRPSAPRSTRTTP